MADTLNELLEAELKQDARYERNEQHHGYCSRRCNGNLTTTPVDVALEVPNLRAISFETAIVEWVLSS